MIIKMGLRVVSDPGFDGPVLPDLSYLGLSDWQWDVKMANPKRFRLVKQDKATKWYPLWLANVTAVVEDARSLSNPVHQRIDLVQLAFDGV